MSDNYREKYLKYKFKYLKSLESLESLGGVPPQKLEKEKLEKEKEKLLLIKKKLGEELSELKTKLSIASADVTRKSIECASLGGRMKEKCYIERDELHKKNIASPKVINIINRINEIEKEEKANKNKLKKVNDDLKNHK